MTVTDGHIEIYLSSTSPYPVTFSWTVIQTGTVSGATAGEGNVIEQELTGTGTVTYYVTATEIETRCSGQPVNIVVTLIPTLESKWVIDEDESYCEESTGEMFGNVEKSGVATRDNCSEGEVGSEVTYTVPENTYYRPTQLEADNVAQADVDTNKQDYANENGTCSLIPLGDYTIGIYEEVSSGTIIQIYAELRDENDDPISATVDIFAEGHWVAEEISTGTDTSVDATINITIGNNRNNLGTYDTDIYSNTGYNVDGITPSTMDGHNIIGI